MEFRELSEFTRTILSIASDGELHDLQIELLNNPEKGKIVKHSGGARKIRMAIGSKGKSGGARIIYYWQDEDSVIWMLKAFLKKDKSDLAESEKADIFKIISDIKKGLL